MRLNKKIITGTCEPWSELKHTKGIIQLRNTNLPFVSKSSHSRNT